MNTPNPNPSPELKACPFCGGAAYMTEGHRDHWRVECRQCGAKRHLHYVGDDGQDRAITAWNTRALSPQTLPAPGEVELREAYIAGFAQALYNLELTPNAFFDAWLDFGQYYGLEKEQFDPDVIHTPALATVAAANDEGAAGQVSRLRAAYDAVADWPEKRGDPMTVGGAGFMDLLKLRNLVAELLDDPAAIGLLSQGGGKA